MTELPPAAQALLGALTADPAAPVKLLITGGVGTGKSTVVAAVREALRAAGRTVRTHPGDAAAATVIDDAQLLTAAQLRDLEESVEDPAATVIVASEPREQHPELRALMSAIEREQPRIPLAPWPRPEVARRLATTDPEAMDDIMALTAGLPFLVTAAAAGWTSDGPARVVETALTERLRRLDADALSALVILSLTSGLGAADVAAALELPADTAADVVDRCHATGLLDPLHGARFAAMVHRCATLVCGATRHRAIESELLRTQIEKHSLSTDLALALAEHGLRDPHLVQTLQDRARQTTRPAATARLLRAAVRAGADGPDLEVRLADALARSGDCTAAAVLADGLLAAEGAHRGAAVRIAASVAAHDGNTGHAADLFDWLAANGGAPGPETSAAGVVVLVGAGAPGPARELAAGTGSGPPTSTARAVRSLADGLLMTLDQPYSTAAARLGQALGPAAAADLAMPDSAAALTTLAALHAGDAVRARAVIGRAVELSDDDPVFGPRHRLLRAWMRMQDGQLGAAALDVEAAEAGSATLHRREALWLSTLRAALARRTGDTGALPQHWFSAMEQLADYSVDLYCLLPLGELWICAERLQHSDRIHYAVDQAFAVLHALGDPPAWSLPLHWAGVHAAILAGSPGAMAPHGQALAGAATDSGFATVLATAGRAWLRVLARQVDPDAVGAAAKGLAAHGLTWDATRLAGEAALQADDARTSGSMLQIARDMKLAADLPEEPGRPAGPSAHRPAPPGQSPLSEREREVAELLLLGMPYRDIGAQLFISAKTVEHHVARIRRRLGAESRSEMLSMLRAILAPVGVTQS